MILTLLTGVGEFFAWIAMIYGAASDAAGSAFYSLALWADRKVREFEDKYGS